MKQELISVIIPIYNTAQYLERCIYSVQNNTYKNLEIICVNDGSTDESLRLLEQMAMCDERIKIISQENRGLPAARNVGIQVARGEYIAYIDSDDWVHNSFFEILLNITKTYTADVVIAGLENKYDNEIKPVDKDVSIRIKSCATDKISVSRALCNVVTGKLYRYNFVKNILFYNVCRGEDTAYNAMIVSNTNEEIKVITVETPLYYYYVGRSDSIVTNSVPDDYLRRAKWYLENLQLFHISDFAIKHAISNALQYRYIGSFCANPDKARENAAKCIAECLQKLKNNKNYSIFLTLYLVLMCSSSKLYRYMLILRDPSYRVAEKYIKEKLESIMVGNWEEI